MKTDMSDAAVTARLRRVEQLRRLCLSLGKATPVDDDAPDPPRSRPRERGNPEPASDNRND